MEMKEEDASIKRKKKKTHGSSDAAERERERERERKPCQQGPSVGEFGESSDPRH